MLAETITKVNTVPLQSRAEMERNIKILNLYKTGSYSYSSIAKMFKITRARVHQIVRDERKFRRQFNDRKEQGVLKNYE